MSQNQFIRKGCLLKCPQKALNPFKQKWQSRWFVLYGNSEHGRVRIEYYDNEKNWQQEKGKRVIPLSNCVSIKPVWNKDYNYVIEIVVQDKTIHLAAVSKDEEKSWFKDLCKAVFGNANRNSIVQVVDKPTSELDFGYHSLDRSSIEGNRDSPRTLHTVEESLNETSESREELRNISASTGALNDTTSVDGTQGSTEQLQRTLTSSVASELSSLVSFESGFDDNSSMASTVTEGSSYPVTVRATIASQKAGMNGTYLLQISPLNLTLIDIPSQSPVCEWPIQYLRRYGRGRTKFSFEAGEKCDHGKGVYTFNTLEGDSIFHLVDMYARGISMRNQMLRKRTSVPEGFRPLGAAPKKLHHSEGKLLDKCSTTTATTPRFTDSASDILSLGPNDSVSQMGTLPKDIEREDDGNSVAEDNVQTRGMSIGSGISLEIAQNISQSGDELKEGKPTEETESHSDGNTFKEETTPKTELVKKVDVSTIEEETLADTLASDQSDQPPAQEVATKQTDIVVNKEENTKKPKLLASVKRSSSLKLPSALRRSNSNKDSSIKKSSSVKRSSSFRNRFFKSKSSEEPSKKERLVSKSDENLTATVKPKDIDVRIAQQEKVKEILAKAIEDDMNRNSETEFRNSDIEHSSSEKTSKKRNLPMRHKSNEMLGNNTPEKSKNTRLSSSFAGYDYKGHAVLAKTNSGEKDTEAEDLRRLQKRTQSVMKKVELYEGLKKQAEECRVNSYTFWRRKSKEPTKVKTEDMNI